MSFKGLRVYCPRDIGTSGHQINNMCGFVADFILCLYLIWPISDKWRGDSSLMFFRFPITKGCTGYVCPLWSDAEVCCLRTRHYILVDRKTDLPTISRRS